MLLLTDNMLIVRNIVTGFYIRKLLAVGERLEIAGQSGVLGAVTATHVVLNSEGRDITVANSTFPERTRSRIIKAPRISCRY